MMYTAALAALALKQYNCLSAGFQTFSLFCLSIHIYTVLKQDLSFDLRTLNRVIKVCLLLKDAAIVFQNRETLMAAAAVPHRKEEITTPPGSGSRG